MREVARQRGGPIYAIVDGGYNWRLDNVAAANRIVDRLGLTRSESGCGAVQWTIAHLRLHASVVSSADGDKKCELGLRADDVRDTVAESHVDLEVAMPMFESNGFTLDPSTCVPYHAGIGKGVLVYQWCRVSLRDGH
jgi:hypothetical protein